MDVKCDEDTNDKRETFNLAKQFFRDDFVRRKWKDVTLGIDYKSSLQHCLYKNRKSFDECSQV